MASIPFHSKSINKTVYAIPDTKHGEYRVYFDPDGKDYWMNMSHILIRNMDGVELPPVLREGVMGRAMSFMSFNNRGRQSLPSKVVMQRSLDALLTQGWRLPAAVASVERDYGIQDLAVNDRHQITFFAMLMDEKTPETVDD